MSDAEESPNIYQRLLAVVEESGAMAKTGTAAPQVGGYAFHKIDDVVEHLRPLFLKHGVIPLVSVLDCAVRDIAVTRSNGKPAIDHGAVAQVAVTFVNAEAPEDKTPPLVAFGEGLDTQDKAAGKAMSYALKNLLLAQFQLRGQPDNEQAPPARVGQLPSAMPPGAPPPWAGQLPPGAQNPPHEMWAPSPHGPGGPAPPPQGGGPPGPQDPAWAGSLPQNSGRFQEGPPRQQEPRQYQQALYDTLKEQVLEVRNNPTQAWLLLQGATVYCYQKGGKILAPISDLQVNRLQGKLREMGFDTSGDRANAREKICAELKIESIEKIPKSVYGALEELILAGGLAG